MKANLKQYKNIAELNLSMIMISTSAVLVRFIPLSPLMLSIIRAIIGLIVIVAFIKIKGISIKIKNKKDLYFILISSALFALHWLTYFEALQRSSVAIGMLALFTFPAITSILEPFFLKTRFNIRHLILALIIILGMYFIGNAVAFELKTMSGIAIGVFSAFLFSVRNLFLKKTKENYDSGLIMGYHFIVMLILFIPFIDLNTDNTIMSYAVYLIFLGVVSTALGHSLFVKSLAKFNVTTASILCSIQPVYGVILAFLFLNEVPEKQTVLGGLIILSTVFFEAVFDSKKKKNIWHNWTKEVKSTPESIEEPRTLKELEEIVANAVKEKKKIKAFGAGHSCSKIAQSEEGILISLTHLNRVIDIDHQNNIVETEAGISIEELSNKLFEKGFALSNMGTIAKQTLAGALSTGTHGSGSKIGSIDQSVEAIEIITETGIKRIDRQNIDLFSAVKVSLGTLGIVSKVWLKVEPKFRLKAKSISIDFDEMLKKIKESKQHRHARFWWAPYPGKVQYWYANKTDEEIKKPNPLKKWYNDIFLGNFIHESLLYISTFNKNWLKPFNKWVYKQLFEKENTVIDRSINIFTLPIKVKQTVMEYALPAETVEAVLKDIKNILAEKDLIVHMPIEIRFAPKNDAWLSMAHQRDTAYIGIISYQPFGKKIAHEDYFKNIHEIFKKYSGRPHWAKKHFYNSEELSNLYPKWNDFKEVAAQWNPKKLFNNSWANKTLNFNNE